MPRYESKFCSFRVPDDWEPQPPFGYAEPGEVEELMSAQALETWREDIRAAEQLAADDKETLPHLLDDIEWLAEGAFRPESSPGDGYFLEYRHLNEDGEPVRVKKTYLTDGPLSVELTVSRPVDGDTEQRGLLADKIASTLTLRNTEFLSRHQPLAILEPATKPDESAGRESSSFEIPEDAPRQDFPACCVSLPLLDGWKLEEVRPGTARYSSGRFILQLERLIGQENDAAAWWTERMEVLQSSKTPLLASKRGELADRGAPWAAAVVEPATEKRWNSDETPRLLQVYVEDRHPLLWSLQGPRAHFDGQIPVVEALIQDVVFLDPEQWQTPLAEPWIDSVLVGPWTCEGPDLYFEAEKKVILQTHTENSPVPLANVRSEIIESVRSNVDTEREFTEDSLDGKLQGVPSLRHTVDGENHYGEPVSLRSLWSTRDETLYSVVVLNRDPQVAQTSFETVTAGIRFEERRA